MVIGHRLLMNILRTEIRYCVANKLLTYCVLRTTQPPTLSGIGHEQLTYGSEGIVWLTGQLIFEFNSENLLKLAHVARFIVKIKAA